ncbi:EF-hand domain-containing protein [Mesorhizobium sp. SP-1A]|uniref:EF-hand domain-containing protein n=1 Tax=Mesorhizobium sp. SP-1A TaxID=3077840 RepID=UPI0028F6D3CB|nr:EF-hand domain-containing protein [Mesorhizobium sp. SP-1A]
MKLLSLALLTVSAFTPGLAIAKGLPEGHRLAELTFETFDTTGRGFIDLPQMLEIQQMVFASMDADGDGKISRNEMLQWDYGFSNLASENNRQTAYQTALKVLHSLWDLNDDGQVDETEFRKASIADFERADIDNDKLLSKKEFIRGFSVLVALRAALSPQE